MKNIFAFIQARMGSSRFPGKVLTEVFGKPMILWQIERLKKSNLLTKTVILTSDQHSDDGLADFCKLNGIEVFRGSENDVLTRFYDAAKHFLKEKSDQKNAILVRLTGDCPLIDPFLIDQGIDSFRNLQIKGDRYQGYHADMPDGMDFEVFTYEALEEANFNASENSDREHVTPYLWKNPEKFGKTKFFKPGFTSGLRFSVDYSADLQVVEQVLKKEKESGTFFGYQEISEYFKTHPEVLASITNIVSNEGLIKSSLTEQKHQITYQGKQVPRYGLEVFDSLLQKETIDWAKRMGIKIFVYSDDEKNKLLNDIVIIRVKNTEELASFLRSHLFK